MYLKLVFIIATCGEPYRIISRIGRIPLKNGYFLFLFGSLNLPGSTFSTIVAPMHTEVNVDRMKNTAARIAILSDTLVSRPPMAEMTEDITTGTINTLIVRIKTSPGKFINMISLSVHFFFRVFKTTPVRVPKTTAPNRNTTNLPR